MQYKQLGRTHIGRCEGDPTATLGIVTMNVPQWMTCREIYVADLVTRQLLQDLFDAGRVVTFVGMCWRLIPRYEAKRRLRCLGDLNIQRYPYVDGWVIECDDHEGHDEWYIERPNSDHKVALASKEGVRWVARHYFGSTLRSYDLINNVRMGGR